MLTVALIPVTASCKRAPIDKIDVQLGASNSISFAPKTAFARYVELAGQSDQLWIQLASYQANCANYAAPPAGEVLVTVTVKVPPGVQIGPGIYPWGGSVEVFAAGETPQALPFARLTSGGRPLPAGGNLVLESLDLTERGLVAGQLHFEDGGEGEPGLFGLRGSFKARLCALSLDPGRQKASE